MAIKLPVLADAYVRATNGGDAAAYIGLFADAAVVDDGGREFHGRNDIEEWSQQEVFAVQVRLEVTDVSGSDDDTLLTTIVDGNFDKSGLPDPVVITHRIESSNGRIARLTCRLAEE